jgi:hypothetical protein
LPIEGLFKDEDMAEIELDERLNHLDRIEGSHEDLAIRYCLVLRAKLTPSLFLKLFSALFAFLKPLRVTLQEL